VEADDLLQQLGRHVRGDAEPPSAGHPSDDAAWEKLARGELAPDEQARLRERAASDPETARLWEAFRPLDEAVKERIAARVEMVRRGRVVVWRRAALIAAPLAAAALVALALRLPRSAWSDPLAMVPEYSLDVAGGDQGTRSAAPARNPSAPIELHAGSSLEIVLRPATAVQHPVVVRAFLVQGASARPWDVPMERSPDGAVRIAGEAGTLLRVPPGSWDLVFTVSPEGAAPPDPDAVARAAHGERGTPPWRLLNTPVRVLDGT
jgi:hypothetical protein